MRTAIQFRQQSLTREDALCLLERLSREGFQRRYPAPAPGQFRHISYELAQLERDEPLLQRFLLLGDLARYARAHGILTGPGSWSLPGSVIAYCLGITDVDPLSHNLMFEPLLSRSSLLRFHLSLPAEGRAELAAYLSEAWPGEADQDLLVEDYTLSRIDHALRLVEASTGSRPSLEGLDGREEGVYALLEAEGDLWFCVFQQGVPCLREFRPRDLKELAAVAALQARQLLPEDPAYPICLSYRRARGGQPLSPAHDLDETWGYPIYREQVIRLLQKLTGCPAAQAAQRVRELARFPLRGPAAGRLCLTADLRPGFLASPDSGSLPVPVDREALLSGQPDGDGGPVSLLAALSKRAVGKSHFLPTALLSYWAAHTQYHYPEAYRQACARFPEPDFGMTPGKNQ